jgi:triosephosphate isomerase
MSASNRTPLIAGNWKMHGSLETSRQLVDGLVAGIGRSTAAEMLLCPPATYLHPVAAWIESSPIKLGSQNLCEQVGSGAFTGEVSGDMLRDLGCSYAIVGHSERRTLYGETDAVVSRKFLAAQSVGLIPILCVGESLRERESDQTEAVVMRQVEAILGSHGVGLFAAAVIAYEPIWAIGTGKTASPEQAQEVHALIRALIGAHDVTIAAGLRILYGGSMKGANAQELLAQQDIDGGLVGGASLDASEFLKIYQAATG